MSKYSYLKDTPIKVTGAAVTVLPALYADTSHGTVIEYTGEIGYWKKNDWSAWNLDVEEHGQYAVTINASCDDKEGGGTGIIEAGGNVLRFNISTTGSASYFQEYTLGTIELPKGLVRLTIRPEKLKSLFFINLKQISLTPLHMAAELLKTAGIQPEPVRLSPQPAYQIDGYKGVSASLCSNIAGENGIIALKQGEYAEFKGVLMGSGRTSIEVEIESDQNGILEIRDGSLNGALIGVINFAKAHGFKKYIAGLKGANGVKDIYFIAKRGSIGLKGFKFLPNKYDYKAWIDNTLADMKRRGGKKIHWPGSMWTGLCKIYTATGERQYLDIIIEIALKWIEAYTLAGKMPNHDFASKYGAVLLADIAVNSGMLNSAQIEVMKEIAYDTVMNGFWEGGGIMNRSIGYANGIAPLLKLLPDIKEADELIKYNRLFEEELLTTMEPLENSTNYEPITYMYLMDWLDSNGKQEYYYLSGIKKSIERLLYLLNSEGGMPYCGDYGGKESYSALLLPVLERAAAVYNDGRYKYLAHRLMSNTFELNTHPQYEKDLSGWAFSAMGHAFEWADDSIAEVMPDTRSAVLCRNTGYLDKAVLRSGWGDGDLLVTVNLLNGSEHSDNDSLAISAISRGKTNYLYDAAQRDDANHSKPLVRWSAANFPRVVEPITEWQFVSLELENYWSWDNLAHVAGYPWRIKGKNGCFLSDEYAYYPERQFVFALPRWGSFKGKATIYLDDIKLISPDGQELLLEDFEGDVSGWLGNFRLAGNPKSGTHCGAFDINSEQTTPFCGKVFNMCLDVHEKKYTRLQFWIRIESENGDLLLKHLFATIGDRWNYPHNYPFHHNTMYPVKQKYFIENDNSVSASFYIEEKDNLGREMTREREITLIKNKMIWVRDTITLKDPGKYICGPIWRFDKVEKQNDGGYLGISDGRLLIYILPRDGLSVGNKTDMLLDRGGERINSEIVFQTWEGETIEAKTLTFDTLLIPLD